MGFVSPYFPLLVSGLLWVYYRTPGHRQWRLLLLASLGYYLLADPRYLGYLLLTIAATYALGRYIGRCRQQLGGKAAKARCRPWLLGYTALLLGLLLLCKLRLTLRHILLPLGLSYYLFQSLGYVLDVYRGTAQPQESPGKLALFLCWLPQLVQGPISRYGQLAPALYEPHTHCRKQVVFGLWRMLWGYFKKLVIAERMAPAVLALHAPEYTGPAFLLLTACYAVRIYGDFTGGIDIALGLSEAFGIPLPENFTRPFFSKSVGEYWRRWHITLGEWMKDYIFYPVSLSKPLRRLSRATRARFGALGRRLPVYAASLATWAATGLWHGVTPNFLLWGLLNCAVIVLSQELTPVYEGFHRRFGWKNRPWYGVLEMLRTFLLMNLIRAADLYPNVTEYFRQLSALLSPCSIPWDALGLTAADGAVLALSFLLVLRVSVLQERGVSIRQRLWDGPPALRTALLWAMCLTVLLLGRYGVGYDSSNFIYNQF